MPKRSNNKRNNKRNKAPKQSEEKDEFDIMVETIDRLMETKEYGKAAKGLIIFRAITHDGDELQQHIDEMINTCHNHLFEEVRDLQEKREHDRVIETLETLKESAEFVINGEDNVNIYKSMIDGLIVQTKEFL